MGKLGMSGWLPWSICPGCHSYPASAPSFCIFAGKKKKVTRLGGEQASEVDGLFIYLLSVIAHLWALGNVGCGMVMRYECGTVIG